MLRSLPKAFCLWMLGLMFVASKIDASHDPQHLTDLRHLLDRILVQNNSYLTGANQVSWPGRGGTYYSCITDSSGLVNGLFSNTYGYSPTDFQFWLGTQRPLVQDYYLAILTHNRFQQITHITDIDPGDFLVVSYPPGVTEGVYDNGHIFIVDKSPKWEDQKSPHIPGTQQWPMQVIDCAITGHGSKDTRHISDQVYRTGLGKGTIRLYIDAQGYLQGYTWNRHDDSTYHSVAEHPLVVGRFIH
jgi:hypothetical protein